MQTPAGSLISAEAALCALEEQSRITPERPCTPSPISVVWWCADAADICLFVTSLASNPLAILSYYSSIDTQTARRIPLTITGGASLELVFTFTSEAGKKGVGKSFTALEPLGITSKHLAGAISDGFITLSETQKAPWNLTDSDKALAAIVSAFFTGNDDLAQYIGTITLTVPIERFGGVTITMNRGTPATAPEVVWVISPMRELTAKETASIDTLTEANGGTMVLPFLRLSTRDITASSDVVHDTDTLYSCLDTLTRTTSALVRKGDHTALPIAFDIFTEGSRTDADYLIDLFKSAWDLSLATGLSHSRWRTSFERRRDSLVDTLMLPPDSIYTLLSSHAVLKRLLEIDPVSVETPRSDSLKALRDNGVKLYGEVLAKIAPEMVAPPKKPSVIEKSIPPETEPAVEEPVARKAATEPVSPPTESEPETVATEAISEPEPDERFLAMSDFLKHVAGVTLFKDSAKELGQRAADLIELALQPTESISDEQVLYLDSLVGNTAATLSTREKVLDDNREKLKKLKEPKKRDIDPDQIETLEQIEMFWQDFVPAALRKLSIKKYDDDVRSTIAREKKAFDDYLALTPDIEEGFIECRDKYWPSAAKITTQKVNALFDDILDLWQLSIGQQLNTLEDFRRERFPGEPPIDNDTSLKTKRRPAMKEKLAVTIPKKPGIITKILTMNTESSVWREQQLATFAEAGKKHFESYRVTAIAWLKDAYDGVRKLLEKHLAMAEKSAEAARKRIEVLTLPVVADENAVSSLAREIAQQEKALNHDRTVLDKITAEWNELKQNTISIADTTG